MEFEEIYEQYCDSIYQYIYFLAGEQRLAEDLTQETFTKVWRALDRFNGNASYKTWIIAIARNTVYDYFKRSTPFRFQSLLGIDDLTVTYTPESWLLDNEAQFELYKALGQLKFEYREAIILTKIEGYSVEEAAHILNWNIKKVHNAVNRGMKKLKLCLRGDEDNAE